MKMIPPCILLVAFVPSLSAGQVSYTPAENASEQTSECMVVSDHPLDRGIAEIGDAWNETEEYGICHCGQPCWESVYDRRQADACYVELASLADNSRGGSVTIDAMPVSYNRLASDYTTPIFTYRITDNSSWIEGRCWYDVVAGETWYAEVIGPGGILTWPDSYWESR